MQQILPHGVVAVACLCIVYAFQIFIHQDSTEELPSAGGETDNAVSLVASTKTADYRDGTINLPNSNGYSIKQLLPSHI